LHQWVVRSVDGDIEESVGVLVSRELGDDVDSVNGLDLQVLSVEIDGFGGFGSFLDGFGAQLQLNILVINTGECNVDQVTDDPLEVIGVGDDDKVALAGHVADTRGLLAGDGSSQVDDGLEQGNRD
jgi:hypothetical protein